MANIGNFAFCSNPVCRVFSLSSGLLMIFNFLNKSARCGWRKGGLIQFQWKDLVGELQVWVTCAAVWSVVLSKSTFPWRRGTFMGSMAECLAASWENEYLQVLSDQCPSQSATNVSPENPNLDSVSGILNSTEIGSCKIHLTFVQKVLHWSSNWTLWMSTIIKIYSSFSWNVNT